MSEVQLLSEANRLMGRRVVELEGQMQGGRSAREVEMEAELAQVGGLMVEGGGNCAGQLRAGAWSWVKRGWRVSCAGQRHDGAQVCDMQIKKMLMIVCLTTTVTAQVCPRWLRRHGRGAG